MPTTTGMKGGGYYNANSAGQRAAMEPFLPWLEAAVKQIPPPRDEQTAIRFLDIGSSEGANAIYALSRAVVSLRTAQTAPVSVCFSDLPSNDYNQLFANLHGDGDGPLPSDVFAFVTAGTAFGRLIPPCSVHVVTTFNAIGFLERLPEATLPHYVLPMPPGPFAPRDGVAVTSAEQAPFAQQAAHDLTEFYHARAAEMIRGGKLLVQVFGRNDLHSTSHGIYDVLSDALLDLVESGDLPREIYEHLIFPIYCRSLEELIEPITTDPQLMQAFQIEQAESVDIPVPFNEALQATGDAADWARSYCGFLRAFTEAILAAAIPAPLSKEAAVEKVYQRIEQRLAEDPARYEFHYISVGVLLTRL
ncbi:class I SAM-dependent methyltransferase [Blastopirellula sp. J2-11]|uniref:class I SAM-dependent methyltransferase n=1 Tax=Blastopirellula sp. J2-11 TaxID=2943192 RepID=UPI0021C987D1|nr:class I SAM-dependent methyltransferase [Blastopirellula sp. J2-11]UUO06164.1 class I SAM-dependent methyltransferase [Blastopirellula sp. J2-11]